MMWMSYSRETCATMYTVYTRPAKFCALFHASLKSIWPPTHSVSSLCHIIPCAGHVTHPTEVVVDQTENKRQQA